MVRCLFNEETKWSNRQTTTERLGGKMMKRMLMIGLSVTVLFLLTFPAWSSSGAGMSAEGCFVIAKGGNGSGNGGSGGGSGSGSGDCDGSGSGSGTGGGGSANGAGGGSGHGPGDGTGNAGDGPKDGTGYGPGEHQG
jgi:hypothetical protein